ncbi:glutamyl-tRNA reductase [Elusimicrobiota bacterium]
MSLVVEQTQRKDPSMNVSASLGRLIIVGVNHKRANIADREKLVIEDSKLKAFLDEFHKKDLFHGLTVLSTCNRIECYGSAVDDVAAEQYFKDFFVERCPGIEKYVYVLRDEQAVNHLFRVAAGLDSMVVGEHQVLGQVKSSYLKSQESGHADKVLNKLFQKALNAGKSARTQTGIAQGITSCGGAAVALTEKVFGNVDQIKIMLIGAGKMAESAAEHLLSKNATSIIVSNRKKEKAQDLARRFNGIAMGLEEGMRKVHEADVIIASTACPHYIVTKFLVEKVMEMRKGKPLALVDLGVPRNIDPKVESVKGIHLYNIDSLELVIQDTLDKRRTEIEAAEKIVKELSDEFVLRTASLSSREN